LVGCIAVLSLASNSYGQNGPSGPTDAPPQAKAAVPVTMTECEGTDNCATWTFLGSQGNGQWPTGEVANLTVERYTNDTVVIRRADSTGASAGLTAVYTGTRHDDRVGGDFTSSWPGHWENKSGNWYATVEAPIKPPSVMHFCAGGGGNCFTLTLTNGRYDRSDVAEETESWTIERFTRGSVILHRHNAPAEWNGFSADVPYKGKVASDGDHLINATIAGKPSEFRLAWGNDIDTVAGSNGERDRRNPQPARPAVIVQPAVVCVPWFFSVVCAR
jgi:hypothetical protein